MLCPQTMPPGPSPSNARDTRVSRSVVTSTLRMTLADSRHGDALRVLRGLLGPVRSHPGCVATRLMLDAADERTLTWVEQWQTREDFERHVRSEAFRHVLAVMDLASEPPTFEVAMVAERHGFELVEELLGAAEGRRDESVPTRSEAAREMQSEDK